MPESRMSAENKRYWSDPACAERYARLTDVSPGEQAALAECEEALRGDVLEIGAGAERLSTHLHRMARSYVGIDYSEAMVVKSRARFPELDFRLGDARDLSPFADASRDAVCMFGSAIDDVEPHERELVLAEVFRVLRPGGRFLFSSHNLDFTFDPPWAMSWLRRRGARQYVRGVVNGFLHRGRQVYGDDWAVLNDTADSFGVLTFYVRKERQVRVLQRSGFDGVSMYGVDEGRPLRPGDPCRDYAIYYTAVRR